MLYGVTVSDYDRRSFIFKPVLRSTPGDHQSEIAHKELPAPPSGEVNVGAAEIVNSHVSVPCSRQPLDYLVSADDDDLSNAAVRSVESCSEFVATEWAVSKIENDPISLAVTGLAGHHGDNVSG